APMLWLIASEREDGLIDGTLEDLAFLVRWPEEKVVDALEPLIERGFFDEDAPGAETGDSTMLAACLHDACSESEQSESESREEQKDHSAAEASPRAARRGTRLAEDWQLSDELRGFASDLGLDPDEVRAEFVDFWTSVPGSRGLKLDWDKTFKNRCR